MKHFPSSVNQGQDMGGDKWLMYIAFEHDKYMEALRALVAFRPVGYYRQEPEVSLGRPGSRSFGVQPGRYLRGREIGETIPKD